ncbi:hydroxypyruvate isomerase family protein [Allomesorhizobium camelthorni]|uniref:TIM barrel protein n=1 Tax=Allomesorhizobium camelthorni TaxID=475069 RepID=A0A6G4WAS1_9HYPH|nr:TIM barrel protein [Mesorhizobium camelthorni]NGO51336.1 TIM barrel protein [Mesorhizobium camelthorni]
MTAVKLSANLGFLFSDRDLPRAIHAAHDAGFAAVELHWPYATEPSELRAALDMTGLPVLGLNTVCGKIANGEFGLAAVPGREADARAAIDQALTYAQAIKCRNVHVMAGRAEGAVAEGTFAANLAYAAAQARDHGIGILIEPLNLRDVPGYFLSDLDKAARIIEAVGDVNVHIMFDCYHMQIMGGDLLNRIRAHLPFIGHVQFAAVPDRQEPDHGEVDFAWLLPAIVDAGYHGPFGAEYKPWGWTEDGLGWMSRFQ